MRVISGKYKGLVIDGINIDGTRPTMDRVKESLFAMIQTKLKRSSCLDLFAGSGSLGIEALSNGANSCVFVDNNKLAVNTIKKNLTRVEESTRIINDHYINALNLLKREKYKFDIIFLDPPYKQNLINDCLNQIFDYDLLNIGGIIICEFETEKIVNDKFDLIKRKKYGSKFISIYQKIQD